MLVGAATLVLLSSPLAAWAQTGAFPEPLTTPVPSEVDTPRTNGTRADGAVQPPPLPLPPIILQSDGSPSQKPSENQTTHLAPTPFPAGEAPPVNAPTVVFVEPNVPPTPDAPTFGTPPQNGAWDALDRADDELLYRRTLKKIGDDGSTVVIDVVRGGNGSRPGDNGADQEIRRAQDMYIRGKILTDEVDEKVYVIDR